MLFCASFRWNELRAVEKWWGVVRWGERVVRVLDDSCDYCANLDSFCPQVCEHGTRDWFPTVPPQTCSYKRTVGHWKIGPSTVDSVHRTFTLTDLLIKLLSWQLQDGTGPDHKQKSPEKLALNLMYIEIHEHRFTIYYTTQFCNTCTYIQVNI